MRAETFATDMKSVNVIHIISSLILSSEDNHSNTMSAHKKILFKNYEK